MKPNIHTAVAEGWGGDSVFLDNKDIEEIPLRVTGGWDWKGVIFRIILHLDGEDTQYHTCRIRAKGHQHEPHTWTTAGFAVTAEEAEARALDRLRRYHGQGFPQPALTGNTAHPLGVASVKRCTEPGKATEPLAETSS